MSDEKFQSKYRIPSARAIWHDYGGGAYFITACSKKHEHFFGEIIYNSTTSEPQMILSTIGEFLDEKIRNVGEHCPYCEIPMYVIMPNHWHAIVFIDGDKTTYQRRTNADAIVVETGHAPSLQTNTNTTINKQMQKIDSMKGWLSVAIGGIKAAITKFANTNGFDFAWQTRFHDRIIRDQKEMNRIADYIENNPVTWDNDCFNKNESDT